MNYLIFSDIHSNLEALETAFSFFEKSSMDKFIFLGDVVGYGANPNEVIELLRRLSPLNCLAGNHDWAVIEKFPLTYFNPLAYEAITWTKRILTKENFGFLHTFPLIYQEKDFVCVHGSLFEPDNFHYIMDARSAYLNFSLQNKKICFIGHTHCREIYILKEDKIYFSRGDYVELEDDAKYIFNVGSIGQPRDGDNRLCFCIYDDKEKVVKFVRLDYCVEKAAKKILKVGLPSFLASRLYRGM
ncbi:MAG: metallophosphoesterase family protein [Candidatus Omnitrophica bacterium]|nr:metallophosphoesterase family protein [Candidatus Omnitrophota bacterium]